MQYIRPRESAGRDGEHHIGGLKITVTSGRGDEDLRDPARPLVAYDRRRTGADLDRENAGRVLRRDIVRRSADAVRHRLQHVVNLRLSVPPRPLPADRRPRTITVEDADTFVFPPLPLDGFHAVDRDGKVVRAEVRNFVRSINPFGITFPEPQLHQVIPPTPWTRVRTTTRAWTTTSSRRTRPRSTPSSEARCAATTCRRRWETRTSSPPPRPSARPWRTRLPGAILESAGRASWSTRAAPANGACPFTPYTDASWGAVYRLWNGRSDTNHRYTASSLDNPRGDDRDAAGSPRATELVGVAFCAADGYDRTPTGGGEPERRSAGRIGGVAVRRRTYASVRARNAVFAIALASYVLSFVHRTAPAAIAGELTQAFDISSAALGALAATYFYVYTLLQVPAGVLADTLGPRRLLAGGSLVAGAGSLLFALAPGLRRPRPGGRSSASACPSRSSRSSRSARRGSTRDASRR